MDKGFPGPCLTSVCVCDTLSLSQTACMVAFSQRRGGGGGSVTLLMLYPLILKLPIHFLLRHHYRSHRMRSLLIRLDYVLHYIIIIYQDSNFDVCDGGGA